MTKDYGLPGCEPSLVTRIENFLFAFSLFFFVHYRALAMR